MPCENCQGKRGYRGKNQKNGRFFAIMFGKWFRRGNFDRSKNSVVWLYLLRIRGIIARKKEKQVFAIVIV
jgi:hypothetical protein